MSVKRFKFVSPGIFINEVDNSQLPQAPEETGPVIIGRSLRGPGMRPVKVDSFSEFVETFGEPIAGLTGDDVWRQGHILGPTYAAYAAQAYLKSAGPVTFVRLLGEQHPDAAVTSRQAGWSVTSANNVAATCGTGAYGLFISNGSGDSLANAQVDITLDSGYRFAAGTPWETTTTALAAAGADNHSVAAAGSGNEFLGSSISVVAQAASTIGAATLHITETMKHHAWVGVDITNAANLTAGGADDTLTFAWEANSVTQTRVYGFDSAAGVALNVPVGSNADTARDLKRAINNDDNLPFFALLGSELINAAGWSGTVHGNWTSNEQVIIFCAYAGEVAGGNNMSVQYIDNGGGNLGALVTTSNADPDGGAAASTANFSTAAGCNGADPTPSATQVWFTALAPKAIPAIDVGGTEHPLRNGTGTFPNIARSLTVDGYISQVRQNMIDAVNNNTVAGIRASGTNPLAWGETANISATVLATAGFSGRLKADPVAGFSPNNATSGRLRLTWLPDAGPDVGGAAAGVFTAFNAADVFTNGGAVGNALGAGGMGRQSADITIEDPNNLFTLEDAAGATINYVAGAMYTQSLSNDPLTGQHGVLAAILFCSQGGLHLTGADIDGTQVVRTGTGDQRGVSRWMRSQGANNDFTLGIKSAARVTGGGNYNTSNCEETISFNFDVNSKNYIRNVLNTNPTLSNTDITVANQGKSYWLAQTFDSHLAQSQSSSATQGLESGNRLTDAAVTAGALTKAAGQQFACLVPLEQTAAAGAVDVSQQNGALAAATPAQSPWIISQHQGTPADWDTASNAMLLGTTDYRSVGVQRLFKIHSLYAGEWDMKNFKISIYDVKGPSNSFQKYGSFGLGIRRASDTDAAPQWIERFSGLTLDPASPDYIARRIGDMQSVWNDTDRRYTEQGMYLNQSRFIRVEVAEDVDSGTADARLLPFGFAGPTRFNSVGVRSGREGTPKMPDFFVAANSGLSNGDELAAGTTRTSGSRDRMLFGTQLGHINAQGNVSGEVTGPGATHTGMTALSFQTLLKFPSLRLRADSRDDTLSSPKDAFYGIDTRQPGTERFDESYADMVRRMVPTRDGVSLGSTNDDEYQFIFTLDDIQWAPDAAGTGSSSVHSFWRAGRYAAGTSINAASGLYTSVLDAGFNNFTLPLIGGQDGLDITEVEPFRHAGGLGGAVGSTGGAMLSSSTQLTHYAYNSVKKAIDTVADPEVVECNMMAMPGIALASLTQHMINVCENRADALAVVDIEDDYVPRNWSTTAESGRMPNVDNAINTLRDRGINSSYACAYFPWVQIRDNIGSRLLWAPPSVVALGTMASSAKKTDVWFAPAGFTRGGLTEGSAGLPVLQVRHRLSSKERDKLYEANINPIAQFPSEGIVIFGQKTLQVTQSALDRINVRRLMIYLKKNVSRMAKTVLFDQNVQTTWSRFISKVDPFLASVKSRFGLTEYKIILDDTTTTPELIDRNIMYAKIFLKPARAIEYIAIDFVITDSGASFDD